MTVYQVIDQSSHRKPPKNGKPSLATRDQPWAQTPHTVPGRIKEMTYKARTARDGNVM